MSLLHPTVGDVVDRKCVVGLKIAALRKNGRQEEAAKLAYELSELYDWLKSNVDNSKVPVHELEVRTLALFFVNERIWVLIDQLKTTPKWRRWRLGQLALEIAAQNDARADLVKRINALVGSADKNETKIYAA